MPEQGEMACQKRAPSPYRTETFSTTTVPEQGLFLSAPSPLLFVKVKTAMPPTIKSGGIAGVSLKSIFILAV
jgi:hypothetical protein